MPNGCRINDTKQQQQMTRTMRARDNPTTGCCCAASRQVIGARVMRADRGWITLARIFAPLTCAEWHLHALLLLPVTYLASLFWPPVRASYKRVRAMSFATQHNLRARARFGHTQTNLIRSIEARAHMKYVCQNARNRQRASEALGKAQTCFSSHSRVACAPACKHGTNIDPSVAVFVCSLQLAVRAQRRLRVCATAASVCVVIIAEARLVGANWRLVGAELEVCRARSRACNWQ